MGATRKLQTYSVQDFICSISMTRDANNITLTARVENKYKADIQGTAPSTSIFLAGGGSLVFSSYSGSVLTKAGLTATLLIDITSRSFLQFIGLVRFTFDNYILKEDKLGIRDLYLAVPFTYSKSYNESNIYYAHDHSTYNSNVGIGTVLVSPLEATNSFSRTYYPNGTISGNNGDNTSQYQEAGGSVRNGTSMTDAGFKVYTPAELTALGGRDYGTVPQIISIYNASKKSSATVQTGPIDIILAKSNVGQVYTVPLYIKGSFRFSQSVRIGNSAKRPFSFCTLQMTIMSGGRQYVSNYTAENTEDSITNFVTSLADLSSGPTEILKGTYVEMYSWSYQPYKLYAQGIPPDFILPSDWFTPIWDSAFADNGYPDAVKYAINTGVPPEVKLDWLLIAQ